MKRVILRADDVCATTDPAALLRVYGPCWERGLPIALAVIPNAAYRFTAGGPRPDGPRPVASNGALCALLHDLLRCEWAEILLHGWQHQPGELVEGTAAEIGRRLDAGRAALHDALPKARVRVLVLPHDHGSAAVLAAARERGLEVCATWAATHGGGRLAHWWGRLRRAIGSPFAPPRAGRWPTDVALLDFTGRRDALPVTERLLRRAAHWQSPLILPQHYWRLLDAEGVPNVRHARWLRWLETMDAREDVAFSRFCDFHG